ncbi:MAG: hypothetical protein LAT83_06220 [Kiritimatiellae bacterium]|nr:hypothetical protein [Kiritimatiellia bacterium]
MIHLQNQTLHLYLLHPEDAPAQLGVRYCPGGYVWQAENAAEEPLFSGPRFPDPDPPPFHGQGAPEAFRWFDLRSKKRLNFHGNRGLAPGIGLVEDTGDLSPSLLEACAWQVDPSPTACTFHTQQHWTDWAWTLTRRVSLEEAGFTSQTRIENTGSVPMDLHWFPHPFFPLVSLDAGGMDLRAEGFSLPPESKGFETDPGGGIQMKNRDHGLGGSFQILAGEDHPTCGITLSHPACGRVSLSGDFQVARLPVWANQNTFSPEPHLEQTLSPGESMAWGLPYRGLG